MRGTEGTSRPLTAGERKLAASMFGAAIDYDRVTINHRKWFIFHQKKYVMAPDGHIWIHPDSDRWSDDFAVDSMDAQELFIHEMTHVWQAQTKGRWYLPLMRHPWCRYDYVFSPGRPFEKYGIEQQAEIVRHVFCWRQGWTPWNAPPLELIEPILPFGK